MLNPNPKSDSEPLALCLHIGASSYGGAIMTADGECVLSIKELGQSNRRDQPYDNFIDESRQAVEHLLLQLPNGYSQEQIVACGVVVPVPVPQPRERVGLAPSLKGLSASKLTLSLTKMLEEIAGRRIPVELENDGNATCLAERYFGAAKGVPNYIALRLGTGIASGIVVNGQLLRGTRGFAGELGHQTAIQNGERCTCGSRGCVDTVASGKFLLNAARTKCKHNFKSYLDVIEQSVDGRIDMADQFHQIGSHLGAAVSSVANLLDPEKIILSGPMIRAYDLFKDAFAARWKPFPEIQPEVVVTNLGEQSESLAALSVLKYHMRLVTNGDQKWPTSQMSENSQ